MLFSDDKHNQKAIGCFVRQPQNKIIIYIATLFVVHLWLLIVTSAIADNDVELPLENELVKNPLILASSSALSGPTAKLGVRLNQGAQAYFDKINQSGGIAGHQVILKSLDDGYEPYKAVKNTQLFLRDNSIFALFNYVGTPTTSVVFPLIKNKQIPFLMPFTGAEFLRSPVTQNIFNLRASYFQEVDAQLNYLVKEQKITKIGLLIQADKFGIAVEKGYISTMKKYGIKPIVTTRYRRNTKDVALALSVLKSKKVEAVAFVGTYEPFAQLINKAAAEQFTPFFTTVSFISSYDLFSRLLQPSRVLVSEVMPEPQSCVLPICKQFIDDMKESDTLNPDRVQFEGYLNAYLFTEVAKQCSGNISQSCFINTMKNFNSDFGGLKVNFSGVNHQGLNNVYLNFFEMEQ